MIFSTPRFVYTDSLLNDLFPDHVARRAQAFASRKPKLAAQKAHRVNQVATLLNERRGRFLEIGCGFGFGLAAAVAHGFDAVGTELYQGFIDACREQGLTVYPGTIEGIPFPDQSCQVVFLDDVLEHLDQPFDYLKEIARVLEPGGVAMIHTWVIDKPTTVQAAFGEEWRSNLNLDLTAHTTIFPTQLLLDQLEQRGLVHVAAASSWTAGSEAASAIQFCDFYLRKI